MASFFNETSHFRRLTDAGQQYFWLNFWKWPNISLRRVNGCTQHLATNVEERIRNWQDMLSLSGVESYCHVDWRESGVEGYCRAEGRESEVKGYCRVEEREKESGVEGYCDVEGRERLLVIFFFFGES